MKSQTYQLGSEPEATNAGDDDEANFARASVRLLPAEVLLDAIGQALEQAPAFDGRATRPRRRGTRAVQLAGARMGGDFLKVFGKPDRLLTCECERSESTTLAQAFQLINGDAVRRILEADDNRIGRLIQAGTPAPSSSTSCASPSSAAADRRRARRVARPRGPARDNDPRKAWEDVAWALINSKEFLLRH